MPEVTKTMMKRDFDTIPPPSTGRPVSVAVYSFLDKTGQRRNVTNIASLSTAVTQGAETFLIQALHNVGNGSWFDVVERVGIDNLVKERTIIKQMREQYEGPNSKPLAPMQFAGMILEGGIIGYDTSINSGGIGARVFGIGKQSQWSQDVVTVSLRAISVNTGKVLASVTVQKTILSTADSATALKFFDAGTKSFEAEAGLTINEPGTYAVKGAVEMAVVELIKEGQRKGMWEFAYPVTQRERYLFDKSGGFEKVEQPVAEPTPAPAQSEAKQQSEVKEQPEVKTVKTEEIKSGTKLYVIKDSSVVKEVKGKGISTWQWGKGQEVVVVSSEKEWVEVKTDSGVKGFIKKDMLTNVKPE
jgi:curli production assembly/transport component CsgG